MKNKFTFECDDVVIAQVEKSPIYEFFKRTIDLIGAIIGIIFCIPLFIIIGILIKLESSGPIIFKQERVGKNNEIFYIYKFRSMKTSAPNKSTAEFLDSHLYITKTGKFIRKTSIDELPQFFNILKGDMSFIGPRPVIETEYDLIYLRDEYGINKLKPGVTGWAQVNGRDSITNSEKCSYDYEYLINRSFVFDIKILIKTIKSVITAEDIKDLIEEQKEC